MSANSLGVYTSRLVCLYTHMPFEYTHTNIYVCMYVFVCLFVYVNCKGMSCLTKTFVIFQKSKVQPVLHDNPKSLHPYDRKSETLFSVSTVYNTCLSEFMVLKHLADASFTFT